MTQGHRFRAIPRVRYAAALVGIASFLIVGGLSSVRTHLEGYPLLADDWSGLRGLSYDVYAAVLMGGIGFAIYGLPALLLALKGRGWFSVVPAALLVFGSVPFGTGMMCAPTWDLVAGPPSFFTTGPTQLIIAVFTMCLVALPVVLVRRRRPRGAGSLSVGVRPSAVVGTTLLAGGAVALLAHLGPRPEIWNGVGNYCDSPFPLLTVAAFAFAVAWDARTRGELIVGAVVLLLMQGSWFFDLASLPLDRPSASWFKELGAHLWFLMRSGYLLGPIVIPLLIMPASRSLAGGRLARMLQRSRVGSS